MGQLPPTITLGPVDEARRLEQSARRARRRGADDLAALCECLELGLRAAEILGVHRLQAIKEAVPATIGLLLDAPSPTVKVRRDALSAPATLGFTDLLDLLSEEQLECVAPDLHRGWEDRTFSCRRSRRAAQEAIGVTLGTAEREHLLLLAAYRNRIFRAPPPVELVPAEILAAFEDLESLIDRLDG